MSWYHLYHNILLISFPKHIFFLSGEEAKKVFDDAKKMLEKTIKEKKLKATASIAFYPANSVGDDIEVYSEDGKKIATLCGLRQQVRI